MVKYIYCADSYDDSNSLSHAINLKGLVKGLKNREWKKHKWVARKRGKNGKWIYDYGDGFPDEKSEKSDNSQKVIKLDTPEKIKAADKALVKAHYKRLHGGKRKAKFKDLDYYSDDYVVRSGQKVRKSEDDRAYVEPLNPYKKAIFGKTAKEAARKANEEKQKRSRFVMTKRGKQVY